MLFMVVKQGAFLAAVGIALGIAGALILTRLLGNVLSGVHTAEPLAYAAVSVVLFAVTLLASYVPVRRASKVDPLVALRYD